MKQIIAIMALIWMAGTAHAQDKMGGYMLDSIYMLPEARIKDKFLNDTDRYRYNQMKFYVTTILPYMNAATKLFTDLDAKLHEEGLSRKDRKAYVNDREDEMRTQFEDQIKKLNVTQGTYLVKLIARQTELNIYQILKEFKNPLMAVKWQAWGRLHGLNLDRKYDPLEENMLERVMEDLGYPLPAGYHMAAYLTN